MLHSGVSAFFGGNTTCGRRMKSEKQEGKKQSYLNHTTYFFFQSWFVSSPCSDGGGEIQRWSSSGVLVPRVRNPKPGNQLLSDIKRSVVRSGNSRVLRSGVFQTCLWGSNATGCDKTGLRLWSREVLFE